MTGRWELTEEQWKLVEPVLRPAVAGARRVRSWHDARAVLNGVLWVLGTGAQWRELPEKYLPYQICHRRFQQWTRDGKLIEALRLLARLLHPQGKLILEEAFVDAQLPPCEPLGIPHRKLPRNRPPRMPPHDAQAFMRPLLVS